MWTVHAVLLAGAQAQLPQHLQLNAGVRYSVSATPGPAAQQFYMAPAGEAFFELYSPAIRTRYGGVWWSKLDSVPLPPDVVRLYNNSVMGLTGHEVNVVRRVKQPDGSLLDVDVPCTESYVAAVVPRCRASLFRHRPPEAPLLEPVPRLTPRTHGPRWWI